MTGCLRYRLAFPAVSVEQQLARRRDRFELAAALSARSMPTGGSRTPAHSVRNFAARRSTVRRVRMVHGPTVASMAARSSGDSEIPPLGSQ